jgi:YHS domain-containing protein
MDNTIDYKRFCQGLWCMLPIKPSLFSYHYTLKAQEFEFTFYFCSEECRQRYIHQREDLLKRNCLYKPKKIKQTIKTNK